MEQRARLQYLLEKLMAASATDEELIELSDLVRKDASGMTMEEMELMAREERSRFLGQYDRERWMKVADSILEADKRQPAKVFPLRRFRWVAAAAILGAIALGSYQWLRSSKDRVLVSAPVHEIMPGSNKALLALGDGSVVTLDSAGRQVIRQGGTLIYQQGGRLQYDAKADAGAISYNTLTTPRGGQYQVLLPDGSKVWLNAASMLRFPTSFSDSGRLVELSGEAYFEIRSLKAGNNMRVPFRVRVNNVAIEVLGTHFNVNAYPDEIAVRTTLLEGSVKVRNSDKSVIIKPGQQAQLEANQPGSIKVVNDVDIIHVMAWQKGMFEFGETDLATIMRQISRWYDIDIVYEGKLTNEKFGGGISRNLPLSGVLRLLEASGVEFRLEGRKLFVQP